MIRIQTENFDVGAELRALIGTNHAIGGVVTFTGVVRASADDGGVSAMTLEHYPAMTRRELDKIERTANQRWNLEASLIIHRHGRLELGEQIVLVITAAAHRGDAFAASEFLIDWLKTSAPFWKHEETTGGDRWVAARAADDEAAARWTEKPETTSGE
jgi:molybdopterin synthase catalytic subunit